MSRQKFKYLETKSAFKMKWKGFFMIFQGLSLKQPKKIFFERWESDLKSLSFFKTKLQSCTKYLRKILLFMGNSALEEKFDFYFSAVLLVVLTKISKLFHNFTMFNKVLSLKSIDNFWSNLYIPCLWLVNALRFTCGDRKIW